MLARVHDAKVPARWVVADTVYSGDDLRLWLETHHYWYVLAVPCTYSIWTAGHAINAASLCADLPTEAWVRLSAGAGSKGERTYDWAWLQLPYSSTTDTRHWLVIRRSTNAPDDYAYYHAWAPAEITLADLIRVAGTRWVIESGFEQAKGEVGLDHYEVRQWLAWYRHITFALLAHAYLAVVRTMLPTPAADMVPVSVPEVRRLREVLACSEAERQHRLRWSSWRRRHQARAQHCHSQRRQARVVIDRAEIPRARILPGIGRLTEPAWTVIKSFLPVRRSRVGRPHIPHRQVLEGMIAVMQRGVSWRGLPAAFGPWPTVYDRYAEWVKKGIWAQIVAILGVSCSGVP